VRDGRGADAGRGRLSPRVPFHVPSMSPQPPLPPHVPFHVPRMCPSVHLRLRVPRADALRGYGMQGAPETDSEACSRCMQHVQDAACTRCSMYKTQNAQDAECTGCSIYNVQGVVYACSMYRMRAYKRTLRGAQEARSVYKAQRVQGAACTRRSMYRIRAAHGRTAAVRAHAARRARARGCIARGLSWRAR
jgi:hypothetical protein